MTNWLNVKQFLKYKLALNNFSFKSVKLFFVRVIILFVLFISKFSFSQSYGNLASAVSFNVCSSTNLKLYNITNNGVASDAINPGGSFLNNFTLGQFYQNTDTFYLSGGEVKSITNGNARICEISLLYTIYESGNKPLTPVFESLKLTELYNCISGAFSDNYGSCYDTSTRKYVKYKKFDYQINLTNRNPGNYTLEVYFEYSGDLNAGSSCNDRYQINNSFQNYRSQFTILPKPGNNAELGVCRDSSEVSLFSLINATDTTGTWNGPSSLGNGHLGVFNPNNSVFGTYTYTINNNLGCPYAIDVKVNNITPTIKEVLIWDDHAEIIPNNGSVTDYEYSLDSTNWQSSSRFANLLSGTIYNAYIRRKNETCISEPKLFSLISFPNFISPNGDGINDEISFLGTEFLENSNLEIYDTNGKKVFNEISQLNKVIKWNGKCNGRVLSTDTYWYLLRLSHGRTYNGWIFLKNY